ncbi:DUF4263 domain-containing protein [Aeromonas veronii]|uniref:Shedu anti-phage system protein SduA domain-containing protein n=1 Tax=Aeromonas veronii TaxID=654 RepID=UPI003007B874
MTKIDDSLWPSVETIMNNMVNRYFSHIHRAAALDPKRLETLPGFLLSPQKVIFYFGRTHIGIEIDGPESIEQLPSQIEPQVIVNDYLDKDCNLFEKIIGFNYDSSRPNLVIPLIGINQDLQFPTNRGFDALVNLGWNFVAQSSLQGLNSPAPRPIEGMFSRIVNGWFHDANEVGLISRHIKWLDFIPYEMKEDDDKFMIRMEISLFDRLAELDSNFVYPIPDDYKYGKLPQINRFIETWGNKNSSETEITSFLAKDENRFILTMNFRAKQAFPELTCEWQSENKQAIRPDFFVVKPDGYADIVEFKLPFVKGKTIVGGVNRETYSAWLNSYISQTRVYSSYFDDPNNRSWFERKYGFKVHKPRRILVVGRRTDFDSEIWREIASDYRDIDIINFDDFVDSVVAQFYM